MENNEKFCIILIDFLNIAYHKKQNGKADLDNFNLVRKKVLSLFPKAKVYGIADPSTPYSINKRNQYRKLVGEGVVIQVGPGEEADYYMIKYAENKKNCYIITNDAFRDYNINYKLQERIIPVCIIESEVMFSQKFDTLLLKTDA